MDLQQIILTVIELLVVSFLTTMLIWIKDLYQKLLIAGKVNTRQQKQLDDIENRVKIIEVSLNESSSIEASENHF